MINSYLPAKTQVLMQVRTGNHAIIVIKQKNTKPFPIIILGKKKRIDFLAGTGHEAA